MTQDDFNRVIRYVTVIFRGLFVAFAVFVLTVLGGAYFINSLEKTYTATARLEEKPDGAIPPGSLDPALPSEVELSNKMILSQEVLSNVINDLDLDKVWAQRFLKSKERLTHDQALAHLRNILTIDVKPGTDITAITAASDLPKEAADIANAVAGCYKMKRDMTRIDREDAADSIVPKPTDTPRPRNGDGAVRMISRAIVPVEPTRPDRPFDMMLVYILAAFLSIGIGSSVEVVFLLLRAAERPES